MVWSVHRSKQRPSAIVPIASWFGVCSAVRWVLPSFSHGPFGSPFPFAHSGSGCEGVQRLEQVVLDEGSPKTVVIAVMELLEYGASDAALRTGTSPVTTL